MLAKTILVAALAALLASPTFAGATRTEPKSAGQYGQVSGLGHAPNVIWDVFVNGKYVGSDPCALIRNQMMRDPDIRE